MSCSARYSRLDQAADLAVDRTDRWNLRERAAESAHEVFHRLAPAADDCFLGRIGDQDVNSVLAGNAPCAPHQETWAQCRRPSQPARSGRAPRRAGPPRMDRPNPSGRATRIEAARAARRGPPTLGARPRPRPRPCCSQSPREEPLPTGRARRSPDTRPTRCPGWELDGPVNDSRRLAVPPDQGIELVAEIPRSRRRVSAGPPAKASKARVPSPGSDFPVQGRRTPGDSRPKRPVESR